MAQSTKFRLVSQLLTEQKLNSHFRYDGPMSFPANVYDSHNPENDLKDGDVAFLLHFMPGSDIQQIYFRSSDEAEVESIVDLIQKNYIK